MHTELSQVIEFQMYTTTDIDNILACTLTTPGHLSLTHNHIFSLAK